MSTLNLNTASPSIHLGWKVQECTQTKVNSLVVEKFQKIIDACHRSRQEVKNNLNTLNQGIWYPNEYFELLSENNQNKRIEFLKKKSAFYDGLPPKHFIHIPDPTGFSATGKLLFSYVLSKDSEMSPSDVIKKIMDFSFSFMDCQEAIQIAQYQTLLEILGEDKFNQLFDPKGENPLNFDPYTPHIPLEQFRESKTGSAEVGEEVFFKNVPLYNLKHFYGEWGGHHAVCIQTDPEQRFLAFGLPSRGMTKEEIINFLIEKFNETPIQGDAILSPQVAEKAFRIAITNEQDKQRTEIAKTVKMTKQMFQQAAASSPGSIGLSPTCFYLSANKIIKYLS